MSRQQDFLENRILHITGYMGEAGIGKAISSLLLNEDRYEHILLCLEASKKARETDKCRNHGIRVIEEPDRKAVEKEISDADIVVIHWWDYPVMNEFLAGFPEIPCRIILWSHCSGVTYPYLPADFILCFDRVFFTSPYSFENQESDIVNYLAEQYGVEDRIPKYPDSKGTCFYADQKEMLKDYGWKAEVDIYHGIDEMRRP